MQLSLTGSLTADRVTGGFLSPSTLHWMQCILSPFRILQLCRALIYAALSVLSLQNDNFYAKSSAHKMLRNKASRVVSAREEITRALCVLLEYKTT